MLNATNSNFMNCIWKKIDISKQKYLYNFYKNLILNGSEYLKVTKHLISRLFDSIKKRVC